ncbi:hypothetical protein [Roseicyclus mahoneyensis]|jgi:hypothetical protein|uniref:Glycosyl transferase family 11 n=1 Tax=Roseicyclus mahoneyensis TaxID=164332 RepID=A0A316GHL8_9RHOB|nr:hypothetical protein [Roseicyclus mahoneyensis]PWK60556.1 hypothetical protein C7455_104193 [Roseicyclus mahoneyensis]
MIPIVIKPRGRLGNLMFQLMLALKIQERLDCKSEIFGISIPEWNIFKERGPALKNPLLLSGHTFDLDEVCYLLRSGAVDGVLINGWGMRVEYYGDPRLYNQIFPPQKQESFFGDDVILVNVRAEDITSGRYRGYYPLPLDYYEKVIRESGRHPVFFGQLDGQSYIDILKEHFSEAEFLPQASPIVDFGRLRSAKHVCLSISSFAWLGTWLSSVAETIHMPVAGIFDPRPGIQNLIPANDPRYHYWEVKIPSMKERSKIDSMLWISNYSGSRKIEKRMLHSIIAAGATRRVNNKVFQEFINRSAPGK